MFPKGFRSGDCGGHDNKVELPLSMEVAVSRIIYDLPKIHLPLIVSK